MLNMFCTIKEGAQAIWNLAAGAVFMKRNEVVVGITEGGRNAALLYMHEQGIPSHNVPPRPVLKPALAQEEVRDMVKQEMHDAMMAAIVEGDRNKGRQCLEKAGMIGRDACKKYITEGGHLAPNAPSTVAKKGSSTPLIDTGSMCNAITYEVRKKW